MSQHNAIEPFGARNRVPTGCLSVALGEGLPTRPPRATAAGRSALALRTCWIAPEILWAHVQAFARGMPALLGERTMPTQIFAPCVWPCRLVAAEVTDEAARPCWMRASVLLGTRLRNWATSLRSAAPVHSRASAAGSPGREPRADQRAAAVPPVARTSRRGLREAARATVGGGRPRPARVA